MKKRFLHTLSSVAMEQPSKSAMQYTFTGVMISAPRPASRFDKYDSLESYKKKDLPSVVYHVSYDEWYYQLTEYDDDEMKALFDKYKI